MEQRLSLLALLRRRQCAGKPVSGHCQDALILSSSLDLSEAMIYIDDWRLELLLLDPLLPLPGF